jgi:Gas vesicle synthesis protein GvpL/GvpF
MTTSSQDPDQPSEAEVTPEPHPTYVYGIVAAEHPCDIRGVTGVGGASSPLRRLDAGRTAAVIGDAPPDLRARRRDVLAHQEVVDMLAAQGTVLPMRFGVLARDEKSLRDELVEESDTHLAMLRDLEGLLEYNIKAFVDDDELIRHVALNDKHIRWLRSRTTETVDDRIKLGEAVAESVQVQQHAIAEHILESLERKAVRSSGGPPVKGVALNASFLIHRASLAGFNQAIDDLAAGLGPTIRLQRTGPLPPYSFVSLPDK